jgi:hypothetical protein
MKRRGPKEKRNPQEKAEKEAKAERKERVTVGGTIGTHWMEGGQRKARGGTRRPARTEMA